MKKINFQRLAVIGTGPRIREYLLPIISDVVTLDKVEFFSRNVIELKIKSKLSIKSKKIDYFWDNISDFTHVYVCIDPSSQLNLVQSILKKSNCIILMDTPAFKNFKDFFLLNKYRKDSILVAEDMEYLNWPKKERKFFNFISLKYSYFQYHGLAMIQILSGEILIAFKMFRKKLIFISSNGFTIVSLPRDYENGSIYLNGKKVLIQDKKVLKCPSKNMIKFKKEAYRLLFNDFLYLNKGPFFCDASKQRFIDLLTRRLGFYCYGMFFIFLKMKNFLKFS